MDVSDPVPISALNQYAYCPRRCALIHVEQTFEENIYTMRGRDLHERTDAPEESGNDADWMLVANKRDLGGAVPVGAIGVSALTGEGLDTLRGRLAQVARSLTESSGPPPLTQARHRVALQEAAARLAGATTADLPELRAEDLRLALRALGRITGRVGVEDILDTLFARFCIGK